MIAATFVERRQLQLAAHSARMLERVVDARHLSELDRPLEIPHEPQLLEMRDVPEIPDDGTHQRIVLPVEILLRQRFDEEQRARTRLVEARANFISSHEWPGRVQRSTIARPASTAMASSAAGIAPERIIRVSDRASPATIGSPSPPAPMNAASVAVPTSITAAVRTPAMMTGVASGSRTSRRICPSVIPSACAADTAAGSASRTPVYVLRTMG